MNEGHYAMWHVHICWSIWFGRLMARFTFIAMRVGRSINYEMTIAFPQNKHNKFAIKCLNCANGLPMRWSNGHRLNDHSGRKYMAWGISLPSGSEINARCKNKQWKWATDRERERERVREKESDTDRERNKRSGGRSQRTWV